MVVVVILLLVHQALHSSSRLMFTYVTYLFILFFLKLLALRSQNQRMDDSWVCYDGAILISCDWILGLVPLFLGRWGNCAKFCQKFDGAFIWHHVISKWLSI